MTMNFVDNMDEYLQYHLMRLPRQLDRLEGLGTSILFPKNKDLNEFDTIPECCYLVKSGRVICYEYSYGGDQRIYNIMEPGSIFLEECLLFDRPCPVKFRTIEKCELIRIEKCDLKRAFKHDIDIVMDICESLSVKFLSSMEHLRLGPRQGASWKICKMLLTFAAHYGEKRNDSSYRLNRKISQQMMADILGMNRVTVARKIKELKDNGLIHTEDGYMCFDDITALTEYMQTMETEL